MGEALPEFSKPPVTEVVIATGFEPPDGYSPVSIGNFAQAAEQDGFTVSQEHPLYEMPIERFDKLPPAPTLKFSAAPPMPRLWFIKQDGDELIQIQRDWIATNWRKVAPDAKYGRWPTRWESFAKWVKHGEESIGGSQPLKFNQVEVTYINHIENAGLDGIPKNADFIFNVASFETDNFLPSPDSLSLNVGYLISQNGIRRGRLHVSIASGYKHPEGKPLHVMNLTARGEPTGPGIDGVKGFADVAHHWIVRAFHDLTTKEMHTIWGKK